MANDLAKIQIAKIHIAKKALGIDDDTYRAMLRRLGGVDSSADLDADGRRRLLAEFRHAGWKPTPGKPAQAKRLASDPQSRKLRALWIELHQAGAVRDASEAALSRFIARQTGVARIEWLSVAQSRAVIEALKAWSERHTARSAS